MEVAKLKAAGKLEASKRLPLAIALPWRNQPALTNLLAQLYDPASPKFHQWLSPEQFTAAFGPTDADYQKVMAFAQAQGLTVTANYANRMLVDVNGTVSDIERAFHVNLIVYQHPTEARTFFSPDAEPTVDAGLPIIGVSGLDDYMPPRPMNLVVKNDTNQIAYATGSGPGGDFFGADLRAAYAPGVGLTGYGQVIGLFEFGPYFPLDIYLYETNAHLSTNIAITNVLLDNVTGVAPPGTDDGEETLDIDMAIAMAPGASVVVYEGSSAIDILDRMASDGFAKQLSCSFGYYPPPSGQSQVLLEMAMQGQSFFCSSGDGGAYNSSQTIYAPTDDPNCTSVGGTSLTTSSPGGPWQSETTWFGSGGGISPHYTIPPYQQNIPMTANGGSTSLRNIPDVSMLADSVLFWYLKDGQSGSVGGTSASSPMWAGFMALVNQQALANGRGTVGSVNSAASAIGLSANYTNLFHDITTGNDINSGSPTEFFAVPGYDLATGWGSPNGPAFINYLAAPSNSLLITPGIGFAAVQPYGAPSIATNLSLSLTNTGTASFNWAAGGGPAWLDVSSPGGTLAPGSGPATVTVSLDATTVSNLQPGIYLANVYITNQTAGVVEYRLFSLTVSTANFPLATTGFNAGVIVPANATAANQEATAFDLANNIAFYQAGLSSNSDVAGSGGTQGLPAGGVFTSAADGSTVFQFGPYGGNNVLLLGDTYAASGTLSLTTPRSFDSLAVLASSANGGAQGTLVVHFANGTSSPTFNFNAQDWFNTTTNVALSGFGRLDLGNPGLDTENDGSSNPNLYQTVINLAALGSNQPVSSITFTKPAASQDSGVFALSGALMPPPPAIIQQAQSITNNVAASASTFAVVAMGAPPLSFQWYGPAGLMTGAVNNSLTVPNVQTTQAGSYFVVITNNFGAVTSAVATLTVYRVPVITQQPALSNLFLFTGLGASFSVTGNGAVPLNYYWQFNGTNITGANSAGYTLSNAQLTNSGAYAVVLSNSLGAVTSSVVSVTVVTPTPYQQAVLAANPAAYWPLNETSGTVAFDYVGGNNGNYVGAVVNKAAGVPDTGMGTPNYAVQLNGSSAYIDVPGSALNFTTPMSILAWIKTSGGGNFQTVAGKGDSSYRLDVDGSHDPHFADGPNADVVGSTSVAGTAWHQWVGVYDGSKQYLYLDGQLAVSGSAAKAVSGNSLDFWIGGAPDYGTGRLFAGSVDEVALIDSALTSNQIQQIYLFAGVAPLITQQPLTPWHPNQGTTASNTVIALAAPPLSYQWHGPSGTITGATNAILSLTNVQPGQNGNYYVVVTNPNGSTQSSNAFLSVVTGTLTLTTNLSPLSITVYAGFQLSYSVAVTGGNPSFQWYQNSATPVPGATNATYSFGALLGANTYSCVVTGPFNSVVSSTATVIGVPALTSLYVRRVLADHPIAFWHLNEPSNSTVAYDYVGDHNGQYFGDVLHGVACIPADAPDTAAAFGDTNIFGSAAASDSYAGNIPGIDFSKTLISGNAEYSVEAWVSFNVSQNSDGAGIVEQGAGGGTENFDLDVSGTSYRWIWHDATGSTLAHQLIINGAADGNWHHIVGVVDEANGAMLLYMDGSTNGDSMPGFSSEPSPGQGELAAAGAPVNIGSRQSGTASVRDDQFMGSIANVALYNYALSAAQIQAHFIAGTNNPPGAGTGLLGHYYTNYTSFNNFVTNSSAALALTRVDPTVNETTWGTTPFAPGMTLNKFAVRWTGQVRAAYTGTNTFYITVDDGGRLWVNNQLVIANAWVDEGATTYSTNIVLTAGQKYNIEMDYYNDGAGSTAELSWANPLQPMQIIPQGSLYPAGDQAPSFIANPFTLPGAVANHAYAGSIATNVTDPDDFASTLVCSKTGGPTWLTVAANGALSGTPAATDVGTNIFAVQVTDPNGLSGAASMTICVASANINMGIGPSLIQGGNCQLNWSGGAGPYQVQMNTNLSTANWVNVGGLLTTNTLTVPATNPAAFYRILGN